MEAGDSGQTISVLAAEGEAAGGLRSPYVQDEIAVHERFGLMQSNDNPIRQLGQVYPMGGADKLRLAQTSENLNLQRKLVLDR